MRAQGKLRRAGAGAAASREPGPGGRRKRQTFTGRPGGGEEVVFLLLLLFLLILFPQLLPRPSSRSPPVWEPPGFFARTMHGLRKMGLAAGRRGRRAAGRPRRSATAAPAALGVRAGARGHGVLASWAGGASRLGPRRCSADLLRGRGAGGRQGELGLIPVHCNKTS